MSLKPPPEEKPAPVIIKPKKVEPVIQIEKLPTISAFEKAYQEYIVTKNKTGVDMDQFVVEYPLSEALLAKIVPTITEYSSQEALKEMKEYDHLGSELTPLSLLFIKILLKTKDYHRLFNITKILGNFLFVINDLDDKTIPTSIEFDYDKNDKKWKIFIVPPKN